MLHQTVTEGSVEKVGGEEGHLQCILLIRNSHTTLEAMANSPSTEDITLYVVLVLVHLLLMKHRVNIHRANPGGQAEAAPSLC